MGAFTTKTNWKTAFDEEHLLLYLSIHQNFKLWFVPFYNARVRLVTVLQLTTDLFAAPLQDPVEVSAQSFSTKSETPQSKDKEKGNNVRRWVSFSSGNGNYKRLKRQHNSSDSPSSKEAGDQDDSVDFEHETDREKFYIVSQNDLYQTSEFIKFVVPWGVGVFLVMIFQFWATTFCVVGTGIYNLLLWLPQLPRFLSVTFNMFKQERQSSTRS